MSRRSRVLAGIAGVTVLLGLVLRAVNVYSVGPQPLIYRVVSNNNDLDGVEGTAPPGRLIELWYKQRNFIEGVADGADPFSLCAWKNGGNPVYLGSVTANGAGVWRFSNLRQSQTVMIFPPVGAGKTCQGGIMTQLLPRACDAGHTNCTAWDVPTVHWLNVRRPNPVTGTAAGSISRAEQAAIAVADGPNDGPEPTSVVDVDQNGVDTLRPGLQPGQRITWKCGGGGTAGCASVAVHDSTTIVQPDPEYPFILGTLQGHRPGGTVFAAAAIPRPDDLGFTVNINVKARGRFDINLGCDQQKFFDFSVPFQF